VTLEGNRNGGMTQLSDPFVNNIWSHGKEQHYDVVAGR